MTAAHCGDLVYVDVKMVSKIPVGAGWAARPASTTPRLTELGTTNRHRRPIRGYHFVHTAIYAHSRLGVLRIAG